MKKDGINFPVKKKNNFEVVPVCLVFVFFADVQSDESWSVRAKGDVIFRKWTTLIIFG